MITVVYKGLVAKDDLSNKSVPLFQYLNGDVVHMEKGLVISHCFKQITRLDGKDTVNDVFTHDLNVIPSAITLRHVFRKLLPPAEFDYTQNPQEGCAILLFAGKIPDQAWSFICDPAVVNLNIIRTEVIGDVGFRVTIVAKNGILAGDYYPAYVSAVVATKREIQRKLDNKNLEVAQLIKDLRWVENLDDVIDTGE